MPFQIFMPSLTCCSFLSTYNELMFNMSLSESCWFRVRLFACLLPLGLVQGILKGDVDSVHVRQMTEPPLIRPTVFATVSLLLLRWPYQQNILSTMGATPMHLWTSLFITRSSHMRTRTIFISIPWSVCSFLVVAGQHSELYSATRRTSVL